LKCRRPGGAGLDISPELCSLAPRSCASRSDMCWAGDGDRATQAGASSCSSTSSVTPICSCNGCSRLGVFIGVPWGKRLRDGSIVFVCSATVSVQSSCPLLRIGEEKQFSASILAGVKCTSLVFGFGERKEPSTRILGFLDGHNAMSQISEACRGCSTGEQVKSFPTILLHGRRLGGVSVRACIFWK